MDGSELRSTLENLHKELEITDQLDGDTRLRLQDLMGDIRFVLGRGHFERGRDHAVSEFGGERAPISDFIWKSPGLAAFEC